MNICVVGTGYVGLVTGAVFADLGNDVICVDNVREKIEGLKQGRMPIYEPGLEEMVARNVTDGRLTFTTSLADGVKRSELVFIAVGAPATWCGRSSPRTSRGPWRLTWSPTPSSSARARPSRTPSGRTGS